MNFARLKLNSTKLKLNSMKLKLSFALLKLNFESTPVRSGLYIKDGRKVVVR